MRHLVLCSLFSALPLALTACPSGPEPAPVRDVTPEGPPPYRSFETGKSADGIVYIAPGERLLVPVRLADPSSRVRVDHVSVVWHRGHASTPVDRPVSITVIADSHGLPIGALAGQHTDVVPDASAMGPDNGLTVTDHALGVETSGSFWIGLEVTADAPDGIALSVDKAAGKSLVMRADGSMARYDSVPGLWVAWLPAPDGPAPAPQRNGDGISGADEWWGYRTDSNNGWSYGDDSGEPPDHQLGAAGQGQGFLRIDLPPGASGARLTALDVVYACDADDHASGTGRVRWSLVADDDGKPSDTVLGSIDVDVMAAVATPVGEPPVWLSHPWQVELPAHAWLRFETLGGTPAVAGVRYPQLEDSSRIFFRGGPKEPLTQVGTRAYIKLHLDNVGR